MWIKIGGLKNQYPRLYAIAMESAKSTIAHGNKSEAEIDKLDISHMNDWSLTAQGANFWSEIDQGKFDVARKNHPQWDHLFINKPLELVTTNNGLWQH